MASGLTDNRNCFCPPPDTAHKVAQDLCLAVSLHNNNKHSQAAEIFSNTNLPELRAWCELLWGTENPEVHQFHTITNLPNVLPKNERIGTRMPDAATRKALIDRDGYHCRYCGIPVIPVEVRKSIHERYPKEVPWGNRNPDQHAAFQAMWLQYEHVVPYSHGGTSTLENMIIACAPCNFGKMERTLEQLNLSDPRLREPVKSNWNGLTDFRA